MSQVPPVVFGRYRLERPIGSGGMSTVYRAVDLHRDGAIVAVKVLNAKGRNIRAADVRMRREAESLTALQHPNVVRLYDYGHLPDGEPVLVMQYVDSPSLKALLRTREFAPWEIPLLIDAILAGLEVCHQSGVIHRDLKPGNLLVDPDTLDVKIIDLGVVRLCADEDATALTISGELLGSPRFMAPEQWGQGVVDERVDLYALGMVGYCLVLGEHPINERNPIRIFEAHLKGERPPLVATRGGLPVSEALAAVLWKATEPKAAARFQTATEMRAALAPLLHPSEETDDHDIFDDDDDQPTVVGVTLVEDPTPEAVPVARALPRAVPVPAAEQGAAAPEAPKTRDRVFGMPGGLGTSVSKADVERALQASTRPPDASAPAPALAVPMAEPTVEIDLSLHAPDDLPTVPTPLVAPPTPRAPSALPAQATVVVGEQPLKTTLLRLGLITIVTATAVALVGWLLAR